MDSSAHTDSPRSPVDELEALDEAFLRMSAVRDEAGDITDFRYEYANSAAVNLPGHRRDELVGRRLLELFPAYRANGRFDAYARVVETANPLRGEFEFDENGVVGELEVLVCRFGDGLIILAHDISDRKEAERALTTLAAQLQGALTSRVVLEQAKGYLAAQSGRELETAFNTMRRYARDHNRRIHEVAQSVVNGQLDLTDAVKSDSHR